MLQACNFNKKEADVFSEFCDISKNSSERTLIKALNNFTTIFRSSRPQMFFKIGVLKNVEKFIEKNCTRVSFLIKCLKPATLLQKRLWHRCFPVNFAKFLRTFFYRTPLGDCFYRLFSLQI